MNKPPLWFKIIIKTYLYLEEVFKYPKLFFKRKILRKKYRRWKTLKTISTYELENEKTLTQHYLTTRHLKPNMKKLEEDIKAIMNIKEVKYNAIRSNTIEDSDYDVIVHSLKQGSKKTREAIIFILEDMTFHFSKIKDFVRKMIDDKNGFIRETGILVAENGNFTIDERRNIYEKLHQDKNKSVRKRILSSILLESKKHRHTFHKLLQEREQYEKDEAIKESINFVFSEIQKVPHN